MTEKHILIVEDERPLREMVAFGLQHAGYSVTEVGDCSAARAKIADRLPDLLLLDWMLPDMSGLEFARALRRDENTRELPIIMLTARVAEDDKIMGLQSGADDYVTKPFSARELAARIEAVLRRTGSHEETLTAEAIIMNTVSHRITIKGIEVVLGPTEYRLLKFFMMHPERVFSRSQVLDRIWSGVYVEERTVDVHIRRLRRVLEEHGCAHYVDTVRGAGYRFSPQATGDVR
ncbi:MAG TPA: phosphate regulon transcriptional regulator PhoB [Gammaproteobacteria bacterium]|nr:phosphate regulon transcriptional regulator PhoB [Gammaproteobacteria bacterium]